MPVARLVSLVEEALGGLDPLPGNIQRIGLAPVAHIERGRDPDVVAGDPLLLEIGSAARGQPFEVAGNLLVGEIR